MKVMLNSGMALLPGWAQQMSGYRFSPLSRALLDAEMRLLAKTLRWSITRGAYHRAMLRMGRQP